MLTKAMNIDLIPETFLSKGARALHFYRSSRKDIVHLLKQDKPIVENVIKERGVCFHARLLVVEQMTAYGTALVSNDSGDVLKLAGAARSRYLALDKDGKTARATPQHVRAAISGETAIIEGRSPMLKIKRYYTLPKEKFIAMYL